VRKLYDDLGTRHKVFVDLACSSHQAIWEYRHMSLFQASRDWLESGSVNGMREGALRLGD
jgi:hypothetical protein